MRPESAQDQHNKVMAKFNPSKIDTDLMKSMVSAKKEPTVPGLVGMVMRRHGFTREQAEAELEKFGA